MKCMTDPKPIRGFCSGFYIDIDFILLLLYLLIIYNFFFVE